MRRARSRRRRRHRRGWLTRGLLLGLALLLLISAPVVWVETSCYSPQRVADSFQSRLPAQFRRDEVNSYLAYPERSIVQAYQDLAAVTRRGSESDFAYGAQISNYWTALCHIVGYASRRGKISGEKRGRLYLLGVGFSAEMAVKGLYEETIGRLTAWLRGDAKTPEDLFALKVADQYAAYLSQRPSSQFPFAAKLSEFWVTTPFGASNWPRAIERRIALTLEYGVMSIYPQAVGALAVAAPADQRVRSIVEGGDPAGIEGVQVIEKLDGGNATIIETPRHAAFTGIVKELAAANIAFAEIAGNDRIMVALLEPVGDSLKPEGATELFSVSVEARPGWRRVMISVPVRSLSGMMRAVKATKAEIEHVYDY